MLKGYSHEEENVKLSKDLFLRISFNYVFSFDFMILGQLYSSHFWLDLANQSFFYVWMEFENVFFK